MKSDSDLARCATSMVSAAVIGEWVGLHERQVRKLAEQGAIRRDGKGLYELQATVLAISVRSREQAAGRASAGASGGLDLVQERAALAREQAEHVAMRNRATRGELVPLAEISAAVVGMVEVTKRHLHRLPGKLFPGDPVQRKRVADGIEQALLDLSAEGALPEGRTGSKGR